MVEEAKEKLSSEDVDTNIEIQIKERRLREEEELRQFCEEHYIMTDLQKDQFLHDQDLRRNSFIQEKHVNFNKMLICDKTA